MKNKVRTPAKLVGGLLGGLMAAFLSGSASAQVFNGGFDLGFDGWTVVNTPEGVGAPGQVVLFDIDGDGALGASSAGVFSVGRATPTFGSTAGISMSQNIVLQAGVEYRVSFDWATVNDDWLPNLQGGLFNVFINGGFLAQNDGNVVLENSANYGRLEALFTPEVSGSYLLDIQIVRPFFADPAGVLRQYIDNVSVVPVPSPGAGGLVLAGMVWAGRRRRR